MKTFFKVVLTIVMIGFIVMIGVSMYLNARLSEVIVPEPVVNDPVDVMINEQLTEVKVDNVVNYALFGVDCRTDDYVGCRSDVMMVLSYNKDINEVSLISVPRDTYVDISGYGLDKINHSYAFGGATLAVQTLNRALDLDIEHYVTLDFEAVSTIVDAIGGVEVYIDSYEIGQIAGINTEGIHRLNGDQALTYSRIRYVGNGDFERAERQREVIEGALNAISSINLPQILTLINDLLPVVRTNMPQTEMLSLATSVLGSGIPSINQMQVPSLSYGRGTYISGIYYFVPNTLLQTVTDMHAMIHPNTSYEPSKTLLEMSEKIENVLY